MSAARLALLWLSVASARDYPCARLHRDNWNVNLSGSVRVAWGRGAAPAHAAAALLRAALLAAGAAPAAVRLLPLPPHATLCSLPHNLTSLVVAPALPSRGVCGAAERLGAGAAPLAARLQAREWPAPAARRPGARAADGSDCLLLRDRSLPTTDARSVDVYVVDEWEQAGHELRARLAGRAEFLVRDVTRAQLARLVHAADSSFLFLDAELWGDVAGVRPVQEPACAGTPDDTAAVRAALGPLPPALRAALRRLRPKPAELREVLALAARHAAAPDPVEEAACHWLATAPSRLAEWRESVPTTRRRRRRSATETTKYWAEIIVCEEGAKKYIYDYVKAVSKEIQNYNRSSKIYINYYVNTNCIACNNSEALSYKLLSWYYGNNLTNFAGAIVPSKLALPAMYMARMLEVPVVAYDLAARSGVRSMGGDAAQLAAALRRLLAACRWRRVGVLYANNSLVDVALADALLADKVLVARRFLLQPDTASIDKALADLQTARILLVSAGSIATTAVLARAAELNLTRENGYVWIVREYEANETGSAGETRPLSLSPQWRGGWAPGGRAALRERLTRPWPGAAWPSHAAAIADAMITIREGLLRLVDEHDEMRDDMGRENKLKFFWDGIEQRNISGINSELSFDKGDFLPPHIYIEQWGEKVQPRRLGTWGAHELDPECPVRPPPPDGSAPCAAPVGDPFLPNCLDHLTYCALALLAIARALYVIAVGLKRRTLARYKLQAQKEHFERMLARYRGAFAALQSNWVDRAKLELRWELGAGRFGRVRFGMLLGRMPVAVKELREDAAFAEESEFMREASMLAGLQHEHIVRFVGVCAGDGPPLLLMEHAFFGDLRRYLQARRHLVEGSTGLADVVVGPEEVAHVSAEALTRLASEAAVALAFLAARGLVHRDVRAANCLVDSRRALKLADFGMARPLDGDDGEYACRRRALFPVLWMAPETLAWGVSSSASDVWAFGVLALELVTLGERPFGARPLAEVVRAVRGGARPPLPHDASAGTRALVSACWRRAVAERPTAARLAAWLLRRCRALQPALAPLAPDADADSGFGEPLVDLDAPD